MEEVTFQAWWHCYMDGAILVTYDALKQHMTETGHVDFSIHAKEINT